jgi:MFS family permease
VLGPVLGGALVSISWHWVFWFNVPFALLGAAWGYGVLHELARRDTNAARHLGNHDVRGRPHRAHARRLQGRDQRLERPVVIGG